MEIKDIILAVILAVVVIGGGICIGGFKNWLVWAVSEAESLFGSKTGKLKLRDVYDLAIERFPIVAKFIPFEVFSKFVDSALDVMRDMIENNKNIAEAIADEVAETDTVAE